MKIAASCNPRFLQKGRIIFGPALRSSPIMHAKSPFRPGANPRSEKPSSVGPDHPTTRICCHEFTRSGGTPCRTRKEPRFSRCSERRKKRAMEASERQSPGTLPFGQCLLGKFNPYPSLLMPLIQKPTRKPDPPRAWL
jgi:hypothetical protein